MQILGLDKEIYFYSDTFCDDKSTGSHRHPYYCNLHVQCSSANVIEGVIKCSSGECFDPANSRCRPCSEVYCSGSCFLFLSFSYKFTDSCRMFPQNTSRFCMCRNIIPGF